MSDWQNHRTNRRGSLSINVHELTDEGEEDPRVLEEYFKEVVVPLSVIPHEHKEGDDEFDSDEEEKRSFPFSHHHFLTAFFIYSKLIHYYYFIGA